MVVVGGCRYHILSCRPFTATASASARVSYGSPPGSTCSCTHPSQHMAVAQARLPDNKYMLATHTRAAPCGAVATKRACATRSLQCSTWPAPFHPRVAHPHAPMPTRLRVRGA